MLLLALPASSQERAVGIYRVTATITPSPAVVGDARLHLEVRKPAYVKGQYTSLPGEGLRISVKPDMPSMPEMVTSQVTLKTAGKGVYEGAVPLTMPGAWRMSIKIEGEQGNGVFSIPLQVDSDRGGAPATPVAPSSGRPPQEPEISASPAAPPSPASASPAAPPSSASAAPPSHNASPGAASTPTASYRITVGNDVAPRVGDGAVVLDISPPLPEGVTVVGGFTMPGMPMVLPPRPAQRGSDGRYRLPARFPMAGMYTLTIDLRQAVTTLQRQAFSLRVAPASSTWARYGPQALMIALMLVVVCAGGLALIESPPRMSLRTLVGCLLCLGIPLLASTRLPLSPDDAMGMPMDMAAPDMGMSFPDLASPVPVIIQTLNARPFVRFVTTSAIITGEGGGKTRASSISAKTAPPESLQYEAWVSIAEAALLTVGAEATVTTQESLRCNVRLGSISRRIDPATQMVRVSGAVSDPSGRLRVGQRVALRIVTFRSRHARVIPVDAVFEDGGRPAVWKVDDVAGQLVARRTFVRVEARSDNELELSGGLVDGDRIVVSRLDPLEEGRVVTPAAYGAGAYRTLPLPSTP